MCIVDITDPLAIPVPETLIPTESPVMSFSSKLVPEPPLKVSFVVVNSKSELTGCLAITKLPLLKVMGQFTEIEALDPLPSSLLKPIR